MTAPINSTHPLKASPSHPLSRLYKLRGKEENETYLKDKNSSASEVSEGVILCDHEACLQNYKLFKLKNH